MVTITCPPNDTGEICGTLGSAGAGLGLFLEYIVIALPSLLLLLAVLGIVIGIGFAIAFVIRKAITGVRMR